MLKKKKTTASGELVLVKSVRITKRSANWGELLSVSCGFDSRTGRLQTKR